jgi:hypothetical protein
MGNKNMSKMVLPKMISRGVSPKGKETWADGKLNKFRVTEEQYKKLSKREQRMVIAADVIQRLDMGKYRARHGFYLDIPKEARTEVYRQLCNDRDAKKAMAKVKTCGVCARGACFLATLDRVNSLEAYDMRDLEAWAADSSYVSKNGPFTTAQQRVIEACFEKWCNYNPNMHSARRRLRSIMVNIIRNKGEFVGHRGWSKSRSGYGFPAYVKW